MFFSQSPSFLDYQRRMNRRRSQHNAAGLFGVAEIPSDNHIRSLLDAVPASSFYPVFDTIFDELAGAGELDRFRCLGGDVLVTIDGTEYYRSEKIR
ncbi:MAG: ISNCY family transposase, partial [Spirochaetaceae bacterium]